MNETTYSLGIDIGSTTVKIAILDEEQNLLFSDYERHYANIQETLAHLLKKHMTSWASMICIRSSPVPADSPLPNIWRFLLSRKSSPFPPL